MASPYHPARPARRARRCWPQHCGEAGVNILGLQIFPGIEAVTDELVLRTPDELGPTPSWPRWSRRSGGVAVSATPCTEAALGDQPTRYVQAARAILAQPASFPEVVAMLFDAEAEPAPAAPAARSRTSWT